MAEKKQGLQNKISRDIIVITVFALIGLAISTALIFRHFMDIDPIAMLNMTWGRTVLGILFFVPAIIVCLANCYITLLHPLRYLKKHNSMKNYAHFSGLPMLGSIFVFSAGVLLPPSIYTGSFLLFLYVIDGNGLPWFLLFVLRNGF